MKRKMMIFLLIAAALIVGSCSGFSAMADIFEKPEAVDAEVDSEPVVVDTPVPLPAPANYPSDVESLGALQGAYVDVYELVSPSVVNIQVVVAAGSAVHPEIPGFPDFEMPDEMPSEGLGSGFVWDKSGRIVTNNHVVADADRITVTFSDGFSVDAELIGADPTSDLAVLQVDVAEDRLFPVKLADSTQLKVGYLVIAIGNPFGLQGTMTTGVISALGRSLPIESQTVLGGTFTIPDIIQTDAPINPGNSGGVLVDIQGLVVGVTTAIESPVRGSSGIGYVVPSVIVQKVVPALIAVGSYEPAWLGVSGTTLTTEMAEAMNLDADQKGALVITVVEGSPAEAAGLKGSERSVEINGQERPVGGDVLIAIDDYMITDFEDLVAYLARSTEVGQNVELTVLRNGNEKTLQTELAARPEPQPVEEIVEVRPGRGSAWLGILGHTLSPAIAEAMDLDEGQEGVLVIDVTKDGPADEAGLKGGSKVFELQEEEIQIGGDIIVSLQDQPVASMQELRIILQTYEAGEEVDLTVLRNGKEVNIVIILGERPQQ